MKISRQIALSLAVVIGCGGMVLSHTGATGIVKERMDAMKSLGTATKEVGEMLRGIRTYDAARVTALATEMGKHAGETMTERFPEDSLQKPTEALPAIWQEWEDFERLAGDMEKLATALGAASGSPRVGPEARPLTGPLPEASVLAGTPPDVLFLTIGRNCSACHERFRLKQ